MPGRKDRLTVFVAISRFLDALLHPSARYDAMAGVRHRVFIGTRLLGTDDAVEQDDGRDFRSSAGMASRRKPDAYEVASNSWEEKIGGVADEREAKRVP